MCAREIRSYRVQAIVLGHIEVGEADRILKLFSREKGKISVMAKGVRKIRSRKAGHLEPFTRVNIQLARGRNLDIVTQAETEEAYIGLGEDLTRFAFGAYVVEVLDRFTYEEGQHIGLFRLLKNTLGRLQDAPNPETVIHYYEIRLLDQLGFRPQLFECVSCGDKILNRDQFFSPLLGGVLCPKCGRGRTEAWQVKKDVLRYIRHFQRSKWQQIRSVSIPDQIEQGMASLVEDYFTYLLEKTLNTPSFLREIKKRRPPFLDDESQVDPTEM
jgi:DNA repair protein RecO (recombination protein O)